MTLTPDQTTKIATLARLNLTDDETKNITQELNQYLNWINKLQNINTENTEPLTSVAQHNLPQRKDTITEKPMPEKILSNAPQPKNNFFTVPKTVE